MRRPVLPSILDVTIEPHVGDLDEVPAMLDARLIPATVADRRVMPATARDPRR